MKPTNKARETLQMLVGHALMRYGHRKQNTGESGKPGFIIARFAENSEIRKALKELKAEDIQEPYPYFCTDDFDTTEKKRISKILMEIDKRFK